MHRTRTFLNSIRTLLIGYIIKITGSQNEINMLRRELSAVHKVQQNILPASLPQIDGYEFAAITIPAHRGGANGDTFDFMAVPFGSKSIGILLIDGTGKGGEAAISTVVLHSMIHTAISMWMKLFTPEKLIMWLNNEVLNMQSGITAAIVFGILDTNVHTFHGVRQGNTPPYLFYKNGNYKKLTEGNGMTVGVMGGSQFSIDEFRTGISAGSILVLLSDGPMETSDNNGKQFAEEGFINVLKENLHKQAAEILDALLYAVFEHQGKEKRPDHLDDDITIIVVKRLW